MIDDPRFYTNSDRLDHDDEIDCVVGSFISAMDLAEAIGFFGKGEVTVGTVYDAAQIVHDHHGIGRRVVVEMEVRDLGAPPMHGISPRPSLTPDAIRTAAPDLSQHTDSMVDHQNLRRLRRARLDFAVGGCRSPRGGAGIAPIKKIPIRDPLTEFVCQSGGRES